MIKAIFFDFFGVISTEVSPFWFEKHFAPDEAARLKEEYMIPADLGELSEDEVFSALSRLSGEPEDSIRQDFRSRVSIKKDTVALIESLKEKYPIVLVSNAMKGWLKNLLVKEDLLRLFDHVIISGEIGLIKPERPIFDAALAAVGVEPSEAVFLDDSERNVKGACAVGINGILFTTACEARERLFSLGVEL